MFKLAEAAKVACFEAKIFTNGAISSYFPNLPIAW